MKNITMAVAMQGTSSILTITVDLSKNFGASASGKSIIIASTEGNQDVPNCAGTKIGLNVYRSNR